MPSDLTKDRLRALAETRTAEGKVLSAFINLDPHDFPTPAARATEVRAVLDSASRLVRERDDLTSAERTALEVDIQRVGDHLSGAGASEMTGGARGLAVFASSPAGLFEVLPLESAVKPEVRIADRPAVSTIARLAGAKPWWIVLVDRRHARVLTGSPAGLSEIWRTEDDVAGRHDQSPSHARDQGGTSHEHHQRSADKDVTDHLRLVADTLRGLINGAPVSGLILGGPTETVSAFRDALSSDLRAAVSGSIDVQVWTASPRDVLAAATPLIHSVQQGRDEQLVQSLADALGTGKGAAGVADVLGAINELRVRTVAIVTGTSARGTRCPACGRLEISASGSCSACGTMSESVADIVEEAAAKALAQGADIHVLSPGHELLDRHEGIAAGLRF